MREWAARNRLIISPDRGTEQITLIDATKTRQQNYSSHGQLKRSVRVCFNGTGDSGATDKEPRQL